MFFIAAEIMFFAGSCSAFLVLRLGAAVWPPPLQPRLPVAVTAVNTVILLASSVAIVAAFRALRPGDRAWRRGGLGVAAALGALFLAVQGYEWTRLVSFGLTMTSGAYGGDVLHADRRPRASTCSARCWLRRDDPALARGRFADARRGGLRACAMYWHFVVALWPVLYVVGVPAVTARPRRAAGRPAARGGACLRELHRIARSATAPTTGPILGLIVLPFLVAGVIGGVHRAPDRRTAYHAPAGPQRAGARSQPTEETT